MTWLAGGEELIEKKNKKILRSSPCKFSFVSIVQLKTLDVWLNTFSFLKKGI